MYRLLPRIRAAVSAAEHGEQGNDDEGGTDDGMSADHYSDHSLGAGLPMAERKMRYKVLQITFRDRDVNANPAGSDLSSLESMPYPLPSQSRMATCQG
ncbi:uncharacterized protein CIMG_00772 [Coccidioides immitis RS]|uniref:Uncharacterized protein n=1 Tax=Coccidioides immitis (strain RS) TaxID=246410 RepID=J3KHP9_COCIM|nr:uncharacterized protein CIMG_00772 [Coccidioides immitis RS]EAS35418.3 hypothetical protein CIMG_00772 [Coccidioides immitis RS]